MNDYMQVRFDVEPCSEMATDVLAAVLAEIGFTLLQNAFLQSAIALATYAFARAVPMPCPRLFSAT